MKSTLLAMTCFAIAAFAVGCKPSDENSTSQQLERVKTKNDAGKSLATDINGVTSVT